jgi:hypothetical protein
MPPHTFLAGILLFFTLVKSIAADLHGGNLAWEADVIQERNSDLSLISMATAKLT